MDDAVETTPAWGFELNLADDQQGKSGLHAQELGLLATCSDGGYYGLAEGHRLVEIFFEELVDGSAVEGLDDGKFPARIVEQRDVVAGDGEGLRADETESEYLCDGGALGNLKGGGDLCGGEGASDAKAINLGDTTVALNEGRHGGHRVERASEVRGALCDEGSGSVADGKQAFAGQLLRCLAQGLSTDSEIF